ncbi:MAG TPA: M20/M25/M40 family metallo-hydrolase [Puia sp.]
MRKGIIIPLLLLASGVFAQNENLDMAMMAKIRDEGMNHSQVMEIVFNLTDANGARLMQSPGYFKAANWAKTKMASWGLANTNLEAWGKWGKGWELEKYYLAMTSPYYEPLIGFPKTFSKGTDGLLHAQIVLIDVKDSSGLSAYQGKLKDKILLLKRTDSLPLGLKPDATRYSDSELVKMAAFDPKAPVPANNGFMSFMSAARLLASTKKFAEQEGAIGILTTSTRNSDGTVFVQNGIPYGAEMLPGLNDISISYEHFMTLQRLLLHLIPVSVDLEISAKIYQDDQQGYNVVAEIPGTDKNLKDQLVMIGGHLDSWQGSTGATDNAAGSAVMMEVVRILKAVGVQPRRTIRICLWGGEETGLHGSKNYVKNHFTDTATKKFNAAGDKLSVYLNLDNGTGKIRGIYLQGNAAVKPIFDQWFQPFHDLGASTLTLENTGGTDHLSFDAIGLPGFQFIQDPMDYGSRTHHSNMDSYDHLSGEDLKQAATIIAAFVYDAAQRDGKMPRK